MNFTKKQGINSCNPGRESWFDDPRIQGPTQKSRNLEISRELNETRRNRSVAILPMPESDIDIGISRIRATRDLELVRGLSANSPRALDSTPRNSFPRRTSGRARNRASDRTQFRSARERPSHTLTAGAEVDQSLNWKRWTSSNPCSLGKEGEREGRARGWGGRGTMWPPLRPDGVPENPRDARVSASLYPRSPMTFYFRAASLTATPLPAASRNYRNSPVLLLRRQRGFEHQNVVTLRSKRSRLITAAVAWKANRSARLSSKVKAVNKESGGAHDAWR